jgi:large subunit ribosomal protein L31e
MPEEKIFTIPLRKAFDTERTHRSRKAVDIVRNFLEKNMKAENIKIGKSINEKVWEKGIQKPPRKVRIHAIKDNDTVYAELIGIDIKLPTKDEAKAKEEKKKEKRAKIKEERKERKKKTIQEEIKEESGKIAEEPAKEEKKEEKIAQEEERSEKVKEVRKV